MKILVVADANPIISALIGGASREVFFKKTFGFATSEFTLEEVRKFIPYISRKSDVKIEEIENALFLLPLKIYKRDDYIDKIKHAKEIIGKIDKKDVDILALALKLNAPLWSNDRHFTGVKEVVIVKTKDMIVE